MNIIDDLKKVISFKDIVERHTRLTPSGHDKYKGISPFSEEKTASFFVDDSKKVWYCYSTKVGGGFLDFVMKVEGFSHAEALKYLCQLYGLVYEDYGDVKKAPDRFAKHREVTLAAHKFFQSKKEHVVAYLEERGYSKAIIETYELGYSGSGNELLEHLLYLGHTKDVIVQSSLATVDRRNVGKIKPFFYDRLMFPIKDKYGVVIAFTGRRMDQEKAYKYLNSSDTPIFKKKDILWNFSQARPLMTKQDRVFISEGTFDAIMLQEAGFPAIALLTSSINKSQLQALGKVVKSIYISTDNDAAGMKAMAEISETIEELNMDIITFALKYPEDTKDPADFITKYGIKGMEELVMSSQPDTLALVNYYLEKAQKETHVPAAAKRKVLDAVKPYMKKIQFSYRSLDFMERLSQSLNLSQSELRQWFTADTTTSHASFVYEKIASMGFPAPIYERRLMTECMKDLSKVSLLFANLRPHDFESNLVVKVLTAAKTAEDTLNLVDNLKTILDPEDLVLVLDSYAQSASENFDVFFLCQVLLKKKNTNSTEKLTNVLGRPRTAFEKTIRKSIKEHIKEVHLEH